MGRWHGPGPYFPDVDHWSPRGRLRELKRIEAEERNERTKPERRRAHRRQLQQQNP